MPDFHAKMKDKLRSVEQGADTVVWLAISAAAASAPSGKFWQDRDTAAARLDQELAAGQGQVHEDHGGHQ